MYTVLGPLVMLLVAGAEPLGPGDHQRSLTMGDLKRNYHIHIPPRHDPRQPAAVVLSFHGAWTNADIHCGFTGLKDKSDAAGFVLVEPNGTGVGPMLFWNAGLFRSGPETKPADDVAFVARLLDDLATVIRIDSRRVYATGMSNGAMMCYRLAAELSGRIAAIAPVAGTMAIDVARPGRPVPVIHFHGTEDVLVPIGGPAPRTPKHVTFKSLEETVKTWAALDGCPAEPRVEHLPDTAHDGIAVTRSTYGPGRQQAEVVVYTIEGGGHTWPGRQPAVKFLGRSTQSISANDLIWEFFQRHPMP